MILSPLFLDIETTGLDSLEHRIIAIGFSKTYASYVVIDEDEKFLIEEFLSHLHDGVVLVGYNITNFDIPFITARAVKHGLYDEIAIIREVYRIDLMPLVKRYLLTRDRYVRLKDICEFLGIHVEDPVDGSQVPELWKKGDKETIRKHCFADLERLSKLFWKLEKLAAHNLRVRYNIQEKVEFGYP